jgi:hypothetical protein
MTTEPQDAVPAPAKPTFAERTAAIKWGNFRTSARIVGVRISDDGKEIWSHGFNKPHYPITGATAHVEDHGAVIVFRAATYELVIDVPKAARKYARKFAGEFNTWMMNGALGPGR